MNEFNRAPFETSMDPSVDNDHLSRSMIELGEPESLFQISRGRFFAKLAIGVLLILCGLAANYYWWVEGPAQPHHWALALLLTVPITGAGLLWHMYRQRG